MKKEIVFIGTIKKENEDGSISIEENEAVLLKFGTSSYVTLDSVYSTLPFPVSLLNIGLLTRPTKTQSRFVDEESLKHYYPEEERKQGVSLKKLKTQSRL
jgi:hypothetical protein